MGARGGGADRVKAAVRAGGPPPADRQVPLSHRRDQQVGPGRQLEEEAAAAVGHGGIGWMGAVNRGYRHPGSADRVPGTGITVTFTEERERHKAFGVYGAVSGAGAAIGLVLGGLLTQYVSWRWNLVITAPIAIRAPAPAPPGVAAGRAQPRAG